MDGLLDEALDLIAMTAPDFDNGNTNHAPMVAETLVAIGRSDVLVAWVDEYRRGLPSRPAEAPVLSIEWREALVW